MALQVNSGSLIRDVNYNSTLINKLQLDGVYKWARPFTLQLTKDSHVNQARVYRGSSYEPSATTNVYLSNGSTVYYDDYLSYLDGCDSGYRMKHSSVSWNPSSHVAILNLQTELIQDQKPYIQRENWAITANGHQELVAYVRFYNPNGVTCAWNLQRVMVWQIINDYGEYDGYQAIIKSIDLGGDKLSAWTMAPMAQSAALPLYAGGLGTMKIYEKNLLGIQIIGTATLLTTSGNEPYDINFVSKYRSGWNPDVEPGGSEGGGGGSTDTTAEDENDSDLGVIGNWKLRGPNVNVIKWNGRPNNE